MTVADGAGQPVATVESLVLREVDVERIAGSVGGGSRDALFRVDWAEVPSGGAVSSVEVAVVGSADGAAYADLEALGAAVGAGAVVPDVVLVPFTAAAGAGGGDVRRGGRLRYGA